ncbi:hypothetical protein FIBSPDRAFT_859336, partial [Athelia psychrophila]
MTNGKTSPSQASRSTPTSSCARGFRARELPDPPGLAKRRQTNEVVEFELVSMMLRAGGSASDGSVVGSGLNGERRH